MKISDITAVLEAAVPTILQAGYDNSGLVVGSPEREVDSALICVDVTDEVIDEALEKGAGLIISHHPIIFHAIKRLTGSSNTERMVERAIKHGIALYACHTNLDAVKDGLSYRLAAIIGVEDPEVLVPAGADWPGCGFGVTGNLSREWDTVAYLCHVAGILGVRVIRHSDITHPTVCRVSVCTGTGGSQIADAVAAGASLYISSDFRYNDFIDADGRIVVADIGHFESEYCAIDLIYDIIRKKLATFALHKSEGSRNPVNYLV